MALLLRHELQRYRDLIPKEEDCQDEWDASMDYPEKCVTLLVGQSNDEEQLEDADEENHHDNFAWEQTTQNYFLAYHEVKALVQWVPSRPSEAEAYTRFQVGRCACFVYVSLICH